MSAFTPAGISAVVQGLSGYLSDVGKMESANKGLESSGTTLGQKLGGVGKAIGGMALAAGTAAIGAVAGLTAALAGCVKEAAAAETINAQLEAVLKATGGAAGVTAKEANDLATALSLVTPFEDDLIVSAETMLLQFRNISEDVFPETTELALDLAQRLGIDAVSAAKMLGKALEEPGEGLMRLKQAGVSFTDEQEDAIKKMYEAGDAAGAQKMILDELQKSIGGAARAAGETYAGKMEILKNSFGNIKETIGTALLPMLTTLAGKLQEALASPQVQAAIQKVVTWLSVNLPAAITTVSTFITGTLIPAIQKIVGWFQGDGSSAIGEFAGKVMTVLGPAIAFAQGIFQQIVGWVQANWPLISATVDTVMNAISTVVTTVLGIVQGIWDSYGQQIMAVVSNVWTMLQTIITTAVNLILGIIKTVMLLIQGDWEGAWQEIKDTAAKLWEGIKTVILTAWENIKIMLGVIWDGIKAVFAGVWDWFLGIGQSIVDGMKAGIENAWTSFVAWIKGKLEGLVNGVLELLGIKSPSAVFASIGENMMAGLAKGIGDGVSVPVRAVLRAGSMVAGATVAPSVMARGGGAAGNTTYGGDTYNVSVTDTMSAALLNGLMADRRRERRTAMMGV